MAKSQMKIFINIFEDILESNNNIETERLESKYGEDKIQLFKELYCGGTEKFVRLMSIHRTVYFKLTKKGIDYLNSLKLNELSEEQNKINKTQKKINFTILLAISIQALILFSTFTIDKAIPIFSDLLKIPNLDNFSIMLYNMLYIIYTGTILISVIFLIFLVGFLFILLWKNRENY